MKVHIFFLFIFLVQGSCLQGGYEEYSQKNVESLTQWAYVVGGVAATSFLLCELFQKNRIGRLCTSLKTINTSPVKKVFTKVAPMSEMLICGMAHKILRAF